MRRPWGSYTVLDRGRDYQVKRIVVEPGEELSLQLHRHRSEHWIIVCGEGVATIGNTDRSVIRGDYIFIPANLKHRIKNTGNIPLVIIEVWQGETLDEDDIVRYEDKYGRA
jgi:mannose-1-phosphate guanylyltransferase/mannose-6-phosphate isomerase